jgi:predicted XRE-type DNA-binding protein
MTMNADDATVRALRSDMALQIARSIARREETQTAASGRLGIPQPTLSKIMNGRTDELSLELLIRIAVRDGLSVVLQTGKHPAEAGVYLSGAQNDETGRTPSRLSDRARAALLEDARRLTPEQRLAAQVEHSKLVAELSRAGRAKAVR